jgi:hypothetical protein
MYTLIVFFLKPNKFGEKLVHKKTKMTSPHLAHVFSPGGHAGQNRGRRRSNVGAQGQRVHPFQAKAME